MPSLGADMEAGTLVEWLKKPGDTVKRGDIIAVVGFQKEIIEQRHPELEFAHNPLFDHTNTSQSLLAALPQVGEEDMLLLNGDVEAEWAPSENNRRARFYRLTRSGRRRLAAEQSSYERMTAAIGRAPDRAPDRASDRAQGNGHAGTNGHAGAAAVPAQRPAPPPTDPRSLVEREALKLALQVPVLAGPEFDAVDETVYTHPLHASIRRAVAEVGGASAASAGAVWVNAVRDACDDLAAQALVFELAVEPLRVAGEPDQHYVHVQLCQLQLAELRRRIADLKSKIQRMNPLEQGDDYHRLFGELVSLEQHARALREQTAGAL